MATDLREQMARKIPRFVRSRGHPYVELRPNGKKFIYFCTLCLAPCYSDSVLFDHLKGNFHKQRLECAKVTLLGENPWPFNDGLVFFDTSIENDKELGSTSDNQSRVLKFSDNDDGNDLAIVDFVEPVKSDAQPSSTNEMPDDDDCTLLILDVLIEDEPVDLKVREIGLGKIAARFFKIDDAFDGIRRIWCEWLGNENNGQPDGEVPNHDFAVVIFSYNYALGRIGLLADVKSLPPSASMSEPENKGDGGGRKRKRPLSDPEDSDSLSNQCYSSVESSSASNKAPTGLTLTRLISMKAERKELRRKQRLAAEKTCNICHQKMLAGKDVAAFLNLKTRKIVCNSRNGSRAFHVFHVSCVIHWILLCEFHIITYRLVLPKVRQGPKKKDVAIGNQTGKGNDTEAAEAQIKSVFCPECAGSGIMVDGGGQEQRVLKIPKIFKLKMKAIDARKEWIKSPEELQNCSIGFHFPPQYEEIEKVEPVKLLHFYRADQSGA